MLCRSWILPNLVNVSTNPPIPRVTLAVARYAISAEDAKANNKNKQKKHNKDNKDNTNDAL